MPDPIQSLGYEVCRCLLWKSKLLGLTHDPTVPPADDRSFWCIHTQTCIGPDGKLAEPETCKPDRSCYDHAS